MLDSLKRLTIFTGSLGSGKTEVAVNLALNLMRRGKRTALADLDIINPYFRTRLVRRQLEEMGLKVVSPEGRFSFADLPALSPAIKGVIEDREVTGVFDVGGDDVGAVALGQFREMLPDSECQMLFVINTCRPFTRDPEGIIKYINDIQGASGLKVAGLVNNANLGRETGLDTVLGGFETVSGVARITGLPVAFTAVKRDLEDQVRRALGEGAGIMPIDFFMKPPWSV
ncbi:MAG: hypothetical protein ACOY40_10440 [Bacillota bacterium]